MHASRLILLAALASAPLAACEDGASTQSADAAPPIDAEWPDARPQLPFAVGLSQVSADIDTVASELGIAWIRQTIGWDAIEPVVAPNGLTLAQAMSAEALEAYVAEHDFTGVDAQITRLTSQGFRVIAGVGSGWNRSLPTVADGRPAAPDVLGKDEYVARQVLVVRALVERYDGDGVLDAPGSPVVTAWQVENELNEALATAVGSARFPGGIDAAQSAWADFTYVDHIFHSLVAAVRAQAQGAIVLTNFHTSVHPGIDESLMVPTWQDALTRWRGELDWIGLDAYPNYIRAAPLGGDEIGATVADAVALAETRPVIVIETGYGSGPEVLGYDEARQAMFLTQVYAAVRAAGGSGLFWFGTHTSESHSVEIDAHDVTQLARLADAYAAGDIRMVFLLILEDRAYYENHMTRVIDASGAYLGLIRQDGSHKPAWDALATEAAR